jgi:hypothetical protein
VRLLLWYFVAVYLFLPASAAPFTGGASLMGYVLPFLFFDFRDWSTFTVGCWSLLGWFGIAFFLWIIHQFIRYTIRYNLRRLQLIHSYPRH